MRQHSSKGVNIKKGGGGGWGPEGVEGAHKPYPMLCCHSTLSWPLAAAKAKDKGCLREIPSKAPGVTWQHLFSISSSVHSARGEGVQTTRQSCSCPPPTRGWWNPTVSRSRSSARFTTTYVLSHTHIPKMASLDWVSYLLLLLLLFNFSPS